MIIWSKYYPSCIRFVWGYFWYIMCYYILLWSVCVLCVREISNNIIVLFPIILKICILMCVYFYLNVFQGIKHDLNLLDNVVNASLAITWLYVRIFMITIIFGQHNDYLSKSIIRILKWLYVNLDSFYAYFIESWKIRLNLSFLWCFVMRLLCVPMSST